PCHGELAHHAGYLRRQPGVPGAADCSGVGSDGRLRTRSVDLGRRGSLHYLATRHRDPECARECRVVSVLLRAGSGVVQRAQIHRRRLLADDVRRADAAVADWRIRGGGVDWTEAERYPLARRRQRAVDRGGRVGLMSDPIQIGIIGDFDPNLRTHNATNAAFRWVAQQLSIPLEIRWLATP